MPYCTLPRVSVPWDQSGHIGHSRWNDTVVISSATLVAVDSHIPASTDMLHLRLILPRSSYCTDSMQNSHCSPSRRERVSIPVNPVSHQDSCSPIFSYAPIDSEFIRSPPVWTPSQLAKPLWLKLTAALATQFEVPVGHIRKLIPEDALVDQYDRVARVEGGDKMQARDLVKLTSESRDTSYIRVGFPN